MNDLSPKARAVVDVGREPGVFTPADRDRIRRGLDMRLAALGVATATAGAAAAMSTTAKIVLVAAVATVLGGSAASFWALRGRAPAGPAVARESAFTKAPPTSAPPAPPAAHLPLGVVAPPSGTGPSADVRRNSNRPAVSGATVPALDAELSLLRQVREELRKGDAGGAYQHLVDFDRQYGKGPLWPERQALSAIALCRWRPGPQAQARAAEFLRKVPESPLMDRVRSACEKATAD